MIMLTYSQKRYVYVRRLFIIVEHLNRKCLQNYQESTRKYFDYLLWYCNKKMYKSVHLKIQYKKV